MSTVKEIALISSVVPLKFIADSRLDRCPSAGEFKQRKIGIVKNGGR